MEVPELRCPTTPTTFWSTSFCATVVPTFGSAWSSSATRENLTSLPPILIFAALASSMARRAPFSLSLPRWAMPPVSGATCPIFTSCVCAHAGKAAPSAATSSVMRKFAWVIGLLLMGRISYLRRCYGFSARLLLRQDPLHQGADVGIGHRSVGRHRYLAPDSGPALLHLLDQLGFGLLVGAVLGGDVLVGRAHQLLVHGVAGKAGVLFRQLLVGRGGQSHGQSGDRGDTGYAFHPFSLQVLMSVESSGMGCKQVTP